MYLLIKHITEIIGILRAILLGNILACNGVICAVKKMEQERVLSPKTPFS